MMKQEPASKEHGRRFGENQTRRLPESIVKVTHAAITHCLMVELPSNQKTSGFFLVHPQSLRVVSQVVANCFCRSV
jgi:hypothetical protein